MACTQCGHALKHVTHWFVCTFVVQDELKATAEDRDKAREQLELLQQSLNRVSSELQVAKKEKEGVKDDLKTTRKRLKAKEEEYYTFEVGD